MIVDLSLVFIIFLIHFILDKNKEKIFGDFFLDTPDSLRKIHKHPTYLIGGHFIFISYSIFLLFSENGIDFLPLRYCPVMLLGSFITS